jgi:hypothetical protein
MKEYLKTQNLRNVLNAAQIVKANFTPNGVGLPLNFTFKYKNQDLRASQLREMLLNDPELASAVNDPKFFMKAAIKLAVNLNETDYTVLTVWFYAGEKSNILQNLIESGGDVITINKDINFSGFLRESSTDSVIINDKPVDAGFPQLVGSDNNYVGIKWSDDGQFAAIKFQLRDGDYTVSPGLEINLRSFEDQQGEFFFQGDTPLGFYKLNMNESRMEILPVSTLSNDREKLAALHGPACFLDGASFQEVLTDITSNFKPRTQTAPATFTLSDVMSGLFN